VTDPPRPDLLALLSSWVLHLRAERKSAQTVAAYSAAVRIFVAWCEAEGHPARLERSLVQAFTAAQIESGAEAATARLRLVSLRRFSGWAFEEDEIASDELAGLKTPKLDAKTVQPFSEAELKALLKACVGKDFRDRRDEACLRFMLETGARAGEVVAMTTTDVDLNQGVVLIRRGKGGKGRVVPIGAKAVAALDRYIRIRQAHPLAGTPTLWLGHGGRAWSYSALYKALGDRARQAGVEGFHPHRLRHTAADRWLAAGGSEGGLMSVAGWSQHAQLQRYSRARASQRAVEEARNLDLGDL